MRYSDLSVHQLFDLTLAIKELTQAIHERHISQRVSTTTIIQDVAHENYHAPDDMDEHVQPDTIPQLHVHLIPRQTNHNMSNEQLDARI